ncbi:cobalamin biosynthesis protein [Pseudoalteromonas sp. BDTF-M6]|uniref:cobalamin biosynthesis protein CobD/CbiB n=1 Tax=Pseudoalteromonas sp. BDTF-M6 TaxID=2796132 RepID=UPI001BB0A3D6|nr:cobalamin biosynthesis protein [Pseudoalteromonas sp. BDTF-M6]MBS3799036.1 cobalamin biosynthesis protein [Pseudoalteromonas sp. BDTF-M6]
MSNHLELLLLLAAVALARWLPLPSWYHPFTLLRLAYGNLVARTYTPHHSSAYLGLAAVLSIVLCVLLPMLALTLFAQLVFYPELLSALVLYLCLGEAPLRQTSQRIAQALQQKRKSLARALLSKLSNRDVERLTEQGIAKANIEILVLRLLHEYFTPLLLYCLAGYQACFAYALLWQLHQAMRMHAPPNSHYLFASKWLLSLCQLPALVFYLLPLVVSKHGKVAWRYIKKYGQHFYHRPSGWLLSVFSAALQIQLGGPAYYHGERFERMRIGLYRQPEADDIKAALKTTEMINGMWLLVIMATFLLLP